MVREVRTTENNEDIRIVIYNDVIIIIYINVIYNDIIIIIVSCLT